PRAMRTGSRFAPQTLLRHAPPPAGTSIAMSELPCRNCNLWRRRLISALVGSFARGDLLDQFDNTAAKLGVGDARECARQRQAFGGSEKIRHIGRRGAFAEAVGIHGAARPTIEQKRYRHLQYLGDL